MRKRRLYIHIYIWMRPKYNDRYLPVENKHWYNNINWGELWAPITRLSLRIVLLVSQSHAQGGISGIRLKVFGIARRKRRRRTKTLGTDGGRILFFLQVLNLSAGAIIHTYIYIIQLHVRVAERTILGPREDGQGSSTPGRIDGRTAEGAGANSGRSSSRRYSRF